MIKEKHQLEKDYKEWLITKERYDFLIEWIDIINN